MTVLKHEPECSYGDMQAIPRCICDAVNKAYRRGFGEGQRPVKEIAAILLPAIRASIEEGGRNA